MEGDLNFVYFNNPDNVNKLNIINVKKLLESRSNEIEEMFETLKNDKINKKKELIFQKLPFVLRRKSKSYNINIINKNTNKTNVNNDVPKVKFNLHKHKKRRSKVKLMKITKKVNEVKLLDTHVFHAKRFKMLNLWGYKLPIKNTQKSERRVIHHLKKKVLIYDNSYVKVLEIKGEIGDIKECFNGIFINSENIFEKIFITGNVRGTAYLCNNNRLLQPTNFIWLPDDGEEEGTRTIWLFLHPVNIEECNETLKANEKLTTKIIDNIVYYQLFGPQSHKVLSEVLNVNPYYNTSNSLYCKFNENEAMYVTESNENEKKDRSEYIITNSFVLPLFTRNVDLIKYNNHHNITLKNGSRNIYFNLIRERMMFYKNIKEYGVENKEREKEEQEKEKSVKDHIMPILLIFRIKNPYGVDVLVNAKYNTNKLFIMLTKMGCLSIGLEEKRSVLNHTVVSSYPQDYPETKLGNMYYEKMLGIKVQKYMLRPQSVRINYALLGVDNPFILPYWIIMNNMVSESGDEERPRNTVVQNEVLYKSTFTLMAYLTSGLYHKPNAIENSEGGVNTIRYTNMYTNNNNVYLQHVLSNLIYNNVGVLKNIGIGKFVSVRLISYKGFGGLSRLYEFNIEDVKLVPASEFKQMLTNARSMKSSDDVFRGLKKLELNEPLHAEYKMKRINSIVKTLESVKSAADREEMVDGFLNEMNKKPINTTRSLVGFTTSGNIGCVNLRCFFNMVYNALLYIDDYNFNKKLKLYNINVPVWVRNNKSSKYHVGFVSLLQHDILAGIH